MIKYTPYIIQYDNVAEDEKLDYYAQFLSEAFEKKKMDVPRVPGRNNDGFSLPIYYKENPEIESINRELDQIAIKSLVQYYKDCTLSRIFSAPTNGLCSLNVFRTYGKNDSYEWHVDQGNVKFIVSFLLYLNDDFEGGETMFLNDKLKVKPKKGSVLMFPCGPYFIHKSSRIKSGNKHVIWNCFRDHPYFNSNTGNK